MGRIIVSKQLEQATGANYMLQSDVSGNLQFATVASVIAANETTTSVTDNADGSFTYTDEDGADTTVQIPSYFTMSVNYSPTADSLSETVAIIPSQLNGKSVTRFYAYFKKGSGSSQTLSLQKNGVTIASVTGLGVSAGGNVAVEGETVATSDRLTVAFTTTPSGYSEGHGTAVIE